MNLMTCIDCLEPCERNSNRQMRCPECRREAKRESDARLNAKFPKRNARIGKSWRKRNPDKVKAYERGRRKELRAAQKLSNRSQRGGGPGHHTVTA